jgi:TP901 family phage tail tape measure protein
MGAALVGAFAVSKVIKVFAGFEETMKTVRGVTGATANEFAVLEKQARALGATTRFTAQEAGEGLLFLARAGFTVDESLAALPHTLDLAVAGVLDLGTAADIASNVLTQFNLTADETQRVVDVLVTTANSANTSVGQLAEGMKMVGPVAGALGKTVEETSAALGVLGNSGIQASMAGTNLRGMLAKLLDLTGKSGRELRKMGIELKDINPATNDLADIFQKLGDAQLTAGQATKIFGRRNAAAALILSRNVDEVRKLTIANEKARNVAKKLAKEIDDSLSGSMRALKSATEEAMIQMGEGALGSAFRSLVDTATEFMLAIGGVESKYTAMRAAAARAIFFMMRLWEDLKFSATVVALELQFQWKDFFDGVVAMASWVGARLDSAWLGIKHAGGVLVDTLRGYWDGFFKFLDAGLLKVVKGLAAVSLAGDQLLAGLGGKGTTAVTDRLQRFVADDQQQKLLERRRAAAGGGGVGIVNNAAERQRERAAFDAAQLRADASYIAQSGALQDTANAAQLTAARERARARQQLLIEEQGLLRDMYVAAIEAENGTADASERAALGVKKIGLAADDANAKLSALEEASQSIAQTVGDSVGKLFSDLIFEANSWKDALENLLRGVTEAIVQQLIVTRIASGIAGAIGGAPAVGGAPSVGPTALSIPAASPGGLRGLLGPAGSAPASGGKTGGGREAATRGSNISQTMVFNMPSVRNPDDFRRSRSQMLSLGQRMAASEGR